MPRALPNRLLVEGAKDKRIVPELVEQLGIKWGGSKERSTWPAEIYELGGDSKLLKKEGLTTQLKVSGVVNLGVIVDADFDAAARWNQIRNVLADTFTGLPDQIPADGFVHDYDDDGPRHFGVWIMPDNQSRGMIETFLATCIPDRDQGLWPYVTSHCDTAKTQHQAPFKEVHRDKACLHAWLALQDEPGNQLHDAIKFSLLKPGSAVAGVFLAWFRRLFPRVTD